MAPFVGMAPRPVPRVAEQLRRRLVTRHDHEEQERDDLVIGQVVAVDLGIDEGGRQIVGPCAATLVDHVAVVGEERHGGLDSRGRYVVHALVAVYKQIGPPAQLVAVGARHAHELGDHIHGYLAGDVTDEVELALREGGIEVLDRDASNPRFEIGDTPRCETA